MDTPATRDAEAARADWQERSARRRAERGRAPSLDPPGGLPATAGVAQVTLDWEPVEGAAGYLVHRASAPDGAWEPVDFGGNDVLAVPHPPFTDTTSSPGDPAWYAVALVSEVSVDSACT